MAPPNGYDRPDTVDVYILAGGRSRRFGRDKARFAPRGVPLIAQVVGALEPAARTVTVVASRADAYQDLGFRTIADVVEDKGPIGGLLTALTDLRRRGWVMVVACDLVGIESAWVELLLAECSADVQAVVFESERVEPLFGLYHTSMQGAVRRRIARGQLAMHELLAEVPSVTVPAPDGWERVVHLNRPPSTA